jgi:hypothetical protein
MLKTFKSQITINPTVVRRRPSFIEDFIQEALSKSAKLPFVSWLLMGIAVTFEDKKCRGCLKSLCDEKTVKFRFFTLHRDSGAQRLYSPSLYRLNYAVKCRLRLQSFCFVRVTSIACGFEYVNSHRVFRFRSAFVII